MKKLLAVLLSVMLLMIPISANAQGTEDIIKNAGFEQWLNGSPESWVFYSPTGELSQDADGPEINLKEDGFAFLQQEITLEPETCYLITCEAQQESLSSSDGLGANISFAFQEAYSEGISGGKLSICVRTNPSEEQRYLLRIGIGSEDYSAKGSLKINNISIEKLDVIPDDIIAYTLVGEIGPEGFVEEETTSEQTKKADAPSYNEIGLLLCALFFIFTMYLLVTGLRGKQLGDILATRTITVILFVFAFLLRLFLMYKCPGGYKTDLGCFKGWASAVNSNGLSGFYESGIFADYPPAYMYILGLLGKLASLAGIDASSAAMTVLVKLPAVICDVAIGYALYRFSVKKIGSGAGALMSLFVLVSPMLIIVSCAWAQIDSVFTLSLLLVLWLLYRKKTAASLGAWMLCLMIKPQALLIAPVIAIVIIFDLFKKDTRKRTLIETFIGIPVMLAVYAVISLPMKGSQSFFYVFERMLKTVGEYDYASANAFNLFALFGGNFQNANSTLLFGSYKLFGWIFIGLSTVFAAYLYSLKRDRKYIFLTGGVYLTCIFMLSHSMHERYIFAGVVVLMFAAVVHNSRRIFSAATVLSATAFANIFAVLIYEQSDIYMTPELVTLLGSFASVLAFIWLIVCVLRHYAGIPDKGLKSEFVPIPSLKKIHENAAEARLKENGPDARRKLTRKDICIMLAITAIYSVMAFTNLGSLNIPEKGRDLSEAGDSVIIELNENTNVESLWYYAGYCEGYFETSYSYDKESWTLCGENVNHEYHAMFRWNELPVDVNAKYIRLKLQSGNMEFREIGIMDDSGNFTRAHGVQLLLSDGGEEDAPELIDEFDELPQDGTSYMTEMYFDEVYHARTAYEYINGIYPYEITHPPLGKGIIALGCLIFGFNPFGWRFMGALAGVLMLPVMYIFAKRIFKSTRWAAFATALFSVEFMHFVQTRIATIDSFSVLFIMLMYMCMYEYTQHNLLKEKLSKTLVPLAFSGIFFALGAATKWICLYAAPGLCIIFFYTVYKRAKEVKYAKANGMEELTKGYAKKLTLTLIFCVGIFLLIPAAVYIASYLPYYNAKAGAFGLADVWHNQQYMLNYHGNLSGDPHPYQSSVYTWPFCIRPVYFYVTDNAPANMLGVIWCIGNPVMYIGGLASCIGLIGTRKEEKYKLKGLPFILVALAWQIMPWVIITREVFMYHFFSSVPFMIIIITYFMRSLSGKIGKKKAAVIAVIFLAICTVLFILFYPPLTGVNMPIWYARLVKWSPLWPTPISI